MDSQTVPLIVQSLYVGDRGETMPPHPSVRTSALVRYLECAVVQAASLRLKDTPCDLVIATNIRLGAGLSRTAIGLLKRLESLGVRLLPTTFREHGGNGSRTYASSRFGRDAILAAAAGQPAERQLWLTDLDCVWVDPGRVLAQAPPMGAVGCVQIPYPPDWVVTGFGEVGLTPRAVGELAASLGGPSGVPPWIGGDLLCGTAGRLCSLVGECDQLDAQLASENKQVSSEQQVLSLLGALGRVHFHDLSGVARRIHTGARHEAPQPEHPEALGLWHLPAEKGLSLRRAASAVRRGHTAGLRRDLADPVRAAARFNIAGTGLGRRVRDDGWIGAQQVRARLRGGR